MTSTSTNHSLSSVFRAALSLAVIAAFLSAHSCQSLLEEQDKPNDFSNQAPQKASHDDSRYYLPKFEKSVAGDISVENVHNFFAEDEAESLLTH